MSSASTTRRGWPMTRYSAGVLSGTASAGSASFAACRDQRAVRAAGGHRDAAHGPPRSSRRRRESPTPPPRPGASASGPARRTAGAPPSRPGCWCCRRRPADPKRQRGCSPLKSIIIGICSTETCDQSASSSSARIMGSDVLTPCPISAPVAPMTMRLSGSMRIRTPSGFSGGAAGASCARVQRWREHERAGSRQGRLEEDAARDDGRERVHFASFMSRAARAIARRMRT